MENTNRETSGERDEIRSFARAGWSTPKDRELRRDIKLKLLMKYSNSKQGGEVKLEPFPGQDGVHKDQTLRILGKVSILQINK